MIRQVVFHEKAEGELMEALDWYESQGAGLGRIFLDDLERAITGLSVFPESFPVVLKGIRCRPLSKFPYGVMYSVTKDTVRILAIAHRKRRPYYWAKRN